jgi:alpha-L-rhamnosidase
MLKEHYRGMKRVVDYMAGVAKGLIIVAGRYGDHMMPGGKPGEEEFISSETPREFVWTGYFYRAALAVSQAAEVLRKGADARKYARLAGRIKSAFNKKWLKRRKHVYASGAQTAQAFPLALGIVPEADRKGVVACLVKSIQKQYKNHHHTGNTGTTCLIDTLRDLGHGDVMWKILTNTTYPGWGFMVSEGATTIWESWSLIAGCGNAESMIMWATIDEFFYNDLAGIRGPEYYGPEVMPGGFERIRIAPFVPEDLSSAKASMRTVRGTVASAWRQTKTGLAMQVEVPVNATASVSVPKRGAADVVVTESGRTVWKKGAFVPGVDGIAGATDDGDAVTFDVGSGAYRFALRRARTS